MTQEYFRKRIMMMNYGDFMMYAGKINPEILNCQSMHFLWSTVCDRNC